MILNDFNMADQPKQASKNKLYEEAIKWNNEGHRKYLKVDFDDAIADYSKALLLYPNLAVALYNRATVHYRVGNFQLAVRDFKAAVHLEPTNSAFKEGLSECQRLMEELEEKNKVKKQETD